MDTVNRPAGVTSEDVRPLRMIRIHESPHWYAAGAVVLAVLLYISLPERLTVGQNWLLPVLEAALLPPLLITTDLQRRHDSRLHWFIFVALSDESRVQRALSLGLIGVVNAANVGSLILLSYYVLHGGMASGADLIMSAIKIWLTNVIVFGLWYWQLDRGGPGGRAMYPHRPPDFLFPQAANAKSAPSSWRPGFIDYLYLAYTNATAFSPADTMPLTGWAKLLMAGQAMVSLVTAVLVLSRAVNILT